MIGTKRFKVDSDGHHTVTAEEITQYRSYWAFGTVPRLVMELAFELAARRAEIVAIGPQHEQPATPKAPYGKLFVKRLKGSKDTTVPISAELRAAIDACAPFPHLTYWKGYRIHGAERYKIMTLATECLRNEVGAVSRFKIIMKVPVCVGVLAICDCVDGSAAIVHSHSHVLLLLAVLHAACGAAKFGRYRSEKEPAAHRAQATVNCVTLLRKI